VSWDFDRVLTSQSVFSPYHKLSEPSAQIDLSQGYHHYASERRAAGTRQLRRCEYLMRRMAREIGPLRFVPHSDGRAELAQVLAWKSEQYLKSGWKDLFQIGWGSGLVKRIHLTQTPDFAGMLSLLYAGDQLVAGHMGMRSGSVWHYWFPSYDRAYARLFAGLNPPAANGSTCGTTWIETHRPGHRMSLYKKRFMNASVPVAEGSVERPSVLRGIRATRRGMGVALRALRTAWNSRAEPIERSKVDWAAVVSGH
jgi:hypothetical protein